MPKKKSALKLTPAEQQMLVREQVFETTFAALYKSLGLKLSAEEIMEAFRSHGYHHELMEAIHPETDNMVDMEYGRALDDFEGGLHSSMERIIESE